MTPPRKRQVRLVVSLTLAVLLASGLIYTSFASSDSALSPSQLLGQARAGENVQLTGTVVTGSVHEVADGRLDFRLADRAGGGRSVRVTYSGSVPPTFQPRRELIVTGALKAGTFVAQPGSMITKCPSKYSAAPSGSSA
ncbi:MAG TPA: cytochrome c maturation protein CcmE [Solirubrobacteraceae bacterium]|nr:cytochrome c maturation protein CcmE [Solirubrobacteraceae bacterium]